VGNAKPPLQLDEILAMLELFEEVVFRSVLAASERRQDPVSVEQLRHFVEKIVTGLPGRSRRHNARTPW
jgi:hypothetical protein